MIQEIKQLRVQIDGLAQLTKTLYPFKWYIWQLPEKQILSETGEEVTIKISGSESGLIMVGEKSMNAGDNDKTYKYHALIRTNKGTFRIGSNNWSLEENYLHKTFPGIDRNSIEINKAFDSLMLAKAWLGKLLGELGEETPYKNDGNRKTKDDIEPTADVSLKGEELFRKEFHLPYWEQEYSHIEKVDWLRQEIQKLNDIFLKIDWLDWYDPKLTSMLDLLLPMRSLVFQYLSEARFQLGFELQRVKENR